MDIINIYLLLVSFVLLLRVSFSLWHFSYLGLPTISKCKKKNKKDFLIDFRWNVVFTLTLDIVHSRFFTKWLILHVYSIIISSVVMTDALLNALYWNFIGANMTTSMANERRTEWIDRQADRQTHRSIAPSCPVLINIFFEQQFNETNDGEYVWIDVWKKTLSNLNVRIRFVKIIDLKNGLILNNSIEFR